MIGGYPLPDIRTNEDIRKSYDNVVDEIAACIRDAMADVDGQTKA
jgi:hypothetical protein